MKDKGLPFEHWNIGQNNEEVSIKISTLQIVGAKAGLKIVFKKTDFITNIKILQTTL